MIWREGQVADLAVRALEAGVSIDSTLGRRRIDLDGAAVWGQYLDDNRYLTTQWGLLGTTAAVATLALRASPVNAVRHLREALPIIPASRTTYDPRIAPKIDKGDFQNMVRLAFIAEALSPDQATIPAERRPAIVSDILSFAQGEPCWHQRSAIPEVPPAEGDPFTTAYTLYALRRYEDPPGEFRPYRVWLAEQLNTRSAVRRRPDLVAIVGLALIPDKPDPQEPAQIADALERCQVELSHWTGREAIVLDRPLFHGFNLGEWTDYTFLHPEIVTSLFLLRTGNPRPTRRYVGHVMEQLVQNIEKREYFEGQPGMAATVDQLWASKLLDEFHRTFADPTRRHILFPLFIASRRTRWLVVAVAVVAFAAVAALTSNPKLGAVAAALSIVANAVVAALVNWAGGSKQ